MWIVLLAVLLVGALTAFPASSFTSASVDRSATVSIADDDSGLLTLYKADSVRKNKRDVLVSVVNNANRPLDITVTGPTGAVLYGDGTNDDEVVTFNDVSDGSENTVEVESQGDYAGQTVEYTITVSGGGLQGTLTRTVNVSNNNGGGKGAGSGPFCEKHPWHQKCPDNS
jgi:hypothetical protein